MLGEGILMGILMGFLIKGKIENLAKIEFRFWYMILAAGVIEASTVYIRENEIEPLWDIVDQHVLLIKILIYGLLLFAVIYNRHVPGLWLVIIGVFLNGLVIVCNGGRMPVDLLSVSELIKPEQIEFIREGKDLAHSLLTDETRLKLLADIIHIKRPYPWPKSISIGDIFMSLGIVIMLIKSMKAPFDDNAYVSLQQNDSDLGRE